MMNSLVKGIFWTVLLAGLLAVMFTIKEASAKDIPCIPFKMALAVEGKKGRIPFASAITNGGDVLVIFVAPKSRGYSLVLRQKKNLNKACLLGSGTDFSPMIPKHLEQGDPT